MQPVRLQFKKRWSTVKPTIRKCSRGWVQTKCRPNERVPVLDWFTFYLFIIAMEDHNCYLVNWYIIKHHLYIPLPCSIALLNYLKPVSIVTQVFPACWCSHFSRSPIDFWASLPAPEQDMWLQKRIPKVQQLLPQIFATLPEKTKAKALEIPPKFFGPREGCLDEEKKIHVFSVPLHSADTAIASNLIPELETRVWPAYTGGPMPYMKKHKQRKDEKLYVLYCRKTSSMASWNYDSICLGFLHSWIPQLNTIGPHKQGPCLRKWLKTRSHRSCIPISSRWSWRRLKHRSNHSAGHWTVIVEVLLMFIQMQIEHDWATFIKKWFHQKIVSSSCCLWIRAYCLFKHPVSSMQKAAHKV